MLLDPAAANTFISGYTQVLLRVAENAGDQVEGRTLLEVLVDARKRIKAEPALLEQAVVDLQSSDQPFDNDVAGAIRTLRVDDWVYLGDTKTYSVFVQRSCEFALGVLALTQRMRDIVGGSGVLIETGIVRYRGRFVCDGLVSRVVHLGSAYRRSFGDAYRALRASGRFEVRSEA
jgi:hypothetical protein